MLYSLDKKAPALLALEDGTLFFGISVGANGQSQGEIVFNTSMTGYQEILTDPSYAHQIVTLTSSHIGNVGINKKDMESTKIWAQGLIISHLSPISSSWRSETTLTDFLKKEGIVAISEIDTRRLTRIIREKGAQSGSILTGEKIDSQKAIELARNCESLVGKDLAKVVSTKKNYQWKEKTYRLPSSKQLTPFSKNRSRKIVAYDFGVKHQILRLLANRGCDITVVPAQTSADKVIALKHNGIFLSNGPGDPAACHYAIENIKIFLTKEIPLFGICLGHQLLALAVGANTFKMKFGHHGGNHPVEDLKKGTVCITSQNHGFAVDEKTLPHDLMVTHRSLFDGTIQGLKHTTKPAFGFQGHPEASPGPHDIESLFDQFMRVIDAKTS